MSKSIVPIEQRNLMIKDDSLLFFHPDRANAIDHYQHEIDRLQRIIEEKDKTIQDYKDTLNMFFNEKETIKYIKEFRNKLSLICIMNNKKITILQCGSNIKTKKCKFYDRCKPRQNILDIVMGI